MLNHWGLIAAGLVILASVLFVLLTRMRPGYDAYGWLVWGRQTLHWNLDTNGAPSWKPLTFFFTLPYALIGRGQAFLWMVTAVAATLSGALLAARLAFRLTGPVPGRRYAAVVAAEFAALGVLGIGGYWHLVVIANSDPMIVALCLAAIDCHLSGRRRLALLMLVLASLGRPEAWAFAALYGAWVAWRVPRGWMYAAAALVVVPAWWFVISALTAKSVFRAGDLALNSVNVIHGSKVAGVLSRYGHLLPAPVHVAAGFAVALAIYRRDRTSLVLAGGVLAWVATEIAFALHGWSAVPRLLTEPAAVEVALAGSAVGWALGQAPSPVVWMRFAAPAAAVVLIVALVPSARSRVRVARFEIRTRREQAVQIDRLEDVIDKDGGPRFILSCGRPVTLVGFQSTLAWMIGLNVGKVGYKPGREIRRGDPIVVFKPHLGGWQVRPYHLRAEDEPECARLKGDTDFG